ncbi:hypothetical protein CT0861_02858 [Colletotrichum tofieldiae]|uniref:Uncharacterized protein n=1 Tax=Colletotrichum tofieldiae TaxID=708197 RepID=A0A161YKI2_9PEZI|nr:hypothetical protein CT0861_02858 [Colletotrichum tofieldiae]
MMRRQRLSGGLGWGNLGTWDRGVWLAGICIDLGHEARQPERTRPRDVSCISIRSVALFSLTVASVGTWRYRAERIVGWTNVLA